MVQKKQKYMKGVWWACAVVFLGVSIGALMHTIPLGSVLGMTVFVVSYTLLSYPNIMLLYDLALPGMVPPHVPMCAFMKYFALPILSQVVFVSLLVLNVISVRSRVGRTVGELPLTVFIIVMYFCGCLRYCCYYHTHSQSNAYPYHSSTATRISMNTVSSSSSPTVVTAVKNDTYVLQCSRIRQQHHRHRS